MYKHFSFKVLPASLISSASYYSLRGRSFRWGAKWWLDWILGPCDSVGPPNWGVWSVADTALLNSYVFDSIVSEKQNKNQNI